MLISKNHQVRILCNLLWKDRSRSTRSFVQHDWWDTLAVWTYTGLLCKTGRFHNLSHNWVGFWSCCTLKMDHLNLSHIKEKYKNKCCSLQTIQFQVSLLLHPVQNYCQIWNLPKWSSVSNLAYVLEFVTVFFFTFLCLSCPCLWLKKANSFSVSDYSGWKGQTTNTTFQMLTNFMTA